MSRTRRVVGDSYTMAFVSDTIAPNSSLIKALMKGLGEGRLRWSLSSFSWTLGDFPARRPPSGHTGHSRGRREGGWSIVERELILRAMNDAWKAHSYARASAIVRRPACPLIKSYLNRELCFPSTKFPGINQPLRHSLTLGSWLAAPEAGRSSVFTAVSFSVPMSARFPTYKIVASFSNFSFFWLC